MFLSAIDNQVVENYSTITHPGEIIAISNEKQLEKALVYMSHQHVLGFDTETKPRFTAGKMYATALLQLATPDRAYLIHLNKVGVPPSLAALLANPNILKVGAAVRDDIAGLQRYTPFEPGGFVDLQQMAEDYGIVDKSVRKLAAIVLGRRVSKTQQTTNWELFPLTEAQSIYAATDAYVCYKIYEVLLDNPQELKSPKVRIYEEVLAQVAALIDGEPNLIANLANVSALLKESFHFWWVGFYIVSQKDNQLILGPFQGPLACTRIPRGRGVCGAAWERAATVVVPDVEVFPGHIACSARSKSEIVVPILGKQKKVTAVLDIDSEHLAHFDKTDARYLEELVRLLQKFF